MSKRIREEFQNGREYYAYHGKELLILQRALNAVLEWYELYKIQLLEDWGLAAKHEQLKKIPPLE